jgi:hypothetical protein
MANRFFNQFGGTLERKVIKLFAKILYTGGAPTLVDSTVLNSGTSPVTVNESQGFESLTNNGGGAFTLVLGNNNGGVPEYDTYVRLLNVSGVGQLAAGGPPTSAVVSTVVLAEDVAGSSGNPSVQLSTVCLNTGTGVVSPSLPDNGTTLYVEITLSNTTAY